MTGGSWARVRFQDLIDEGVLEIGDGYRAKLSELRGGGLIFLRAVHLTDSHIDLEGVERFSPELAGHLQSKMSRAGDTIVTTKGNSTGRTGFVANGMPEFVYSPHLSFWRSRDPGRLAAGYLRYWARSPEFRDQLAGMKHSTDMAPYLSLRDQRRLTVSLPPILEQRAIAGILGALDDKIELNREMSRVLDDIAGVLFRSWFVDFDPVATQTGGRRARWSSADNAGLFPNTFNDSELGPIPAGWRCGVIGDIADNPRRGVNPSQIDPDTPYIGLEHMPRRSIALSDWGRASDVASGKSAYRRGEILFGKLRPYFHKVGIAPVDGVCSTDILVVIPRQEVWFGLVMGHFSSADFINHADASSVGTKMPRARWQDLARYPIVIPPPEIAQVFSSLARALVNKIELNIHESRTLTTLRDALLPGLFSGDIRVEQADRLVEQTV